METRKAKNLDELDKAIYDGFKIIKTFEHQKDNFIEMELTK